MDARAVHTAMHQIHARPGALRAEEPRGGWGGTGGKRQGCRGAEREAKARNGVSRPSPWRARVWGPPPHSSSLPNRLGRDPRRSQNHQTVNSRHVRAGLQSPAVQESGETAVHLRPEGPTEPSHCNKDGHETTTCTSGRQLESHSRGCQDDRQEWKRTPDCGASLSGFKSTRRRLRAGGPWTSHLPSLRKI